MAWVLIYDFGAASAAVSTSGAGAPGPRGQDGTQIFTGDAAPSPQIGAERDLYIQANGVLWRKTSPYFGVPVAWAPVANLRGADGATGKDGRDGARGLPGPAGQNSADGSGSAGDWAQDLTFVSFRG